MNGCIYLILCLTGVVSTILSIIPVIAVGPIILIFGLMSCEGEVSLPHVGFAMFILWNSTLTGRPIYPFYRMHQAHGRETPRRCFLRIVLWSL